MGFAQDTYTELRTRYKNNISVPTEYPNETFTKPNPATIWARFNTLDGEERIMDIGSPVKYYRTSSQLIIQLFAPLNQGAITVLQTADNIASIFRNWKGTILTCREATVRKIGNDGNGWYQVNVIVSYKVDTTS